jgi:small subunit ribosomal protein S20
MAQHLSAVRQARKAITHRARNRANLSKMKTAVKRVREAKAKDIGTIELKKTSKLLDQLAAKGIIHKNYAANKKSVLTKFVAKLK